MTKSDIYAKYNIIFDIRNDFNIFNIRRNCDFVVSLLFLYYLKNTILFMFDSDYSIRLAILRELGGETEGRCFDSVYEIDLAILEAMSSPEFGNAIISVDTLPTPDETTRGKVYRLTTDDKLYVVVSDSGILSWNSVLLDAPHNDKYYALFNGGWSEINPKIQLRYADVLPTASVETMGFIYLTPKPEAKETDAKDEFITIETTTEGVSAYSWEKIGSTDIDLSGYLTKDEKDADDEIIAEAFGTLNAKVDDNYENLDAKINAKETKGAAQAVKTSLQREIDKNNDIISEAIADVVEMVEAIDPSNFITQDDLDAELSNYYTMGEADEEFATKDELTEVEEVVARDLNYKQDTLVSGTNIKTINGESLLGEGDIVISGVTSESVSNIWVGTQEQYDALTTKDANTLYIING